jgi:hypothetical protein
MPKKKRTKATRVVLPVFRIFCEGEKTEPLYIKGYINHFHSEKRNILVVEKTNKNTPVQLVEVAIEAKKSGNTNDIVWVVFDREAVSKYSHELHAQARQKADANGIEIAFSNVCFEYWILLHFNFTAASYSSCANLLKESNLKSDIKTIEINDYDKGLVILFDKLKEKVPTAIKNAKKLKNQVIKSATSGNLTPHKINPYIDVHELFIDMGNFINGEASIRA